MKLALGTVQFGRDYGVSNAGGQVAEDEVARILARAAAAGIDTLDTAPGYGEAESVLGRVLAAGGWTFRIVTKTPVLRDMAQGRSAAAAVRETLEGSLRRLGVTRLDCLMAHLADDLLGPDGDAVWRVMEEVKGEGVVGRIGTACYTPDEVFALLDRYPLEAVQLPLNLFDQRALGSGLLARLASSDIEVHARSVFLQGLVFMDPDALPDGFSRTAAPLRALHAAATAAGLRPIELAIRFPLAVAGVGRVVVGVTRCQELDDLLAAASGGLPEGCDLSKLSVDDLAVITPSMWPPDHGQRQRFVYETRG